MAIVIGSIKCLFCKGKHGVMHSVHAYGIYGEVGKRHYYHPECLQYIERHPERSLGTDVDMAIYIHDLKAENIDKYNQQIIEVKEKKIEKLQKITFEKMIPK